MKLLPLSQGKFAIIDDADFKKVGHFKWHVRKRRGGNFYAVRNVGKEPNRTTVYLHYALTGIKGIDHKDGNGLNCQRENMRSATQKQNCQAFQRKRAGCASKYRGVYWHKANLYWCSHIKQNGKTFYLGRFIHEKEAARAYDKKAIELGFFREALNFQKAV